MSYVLCQEARGVILRRVENKWAPISIAMFKFFNASEAYAATQKLDWRSAVVTEKIDGSLIRLAYDHYSDEWLLSSNGSIFARDVSMLECNFEQLFVSILGGRQKYEELLTTLNTDYCYFFEVISPRNRICIPYKEEAIYFLGRRNMLTFREDNVLLNFDPIRHLQQYKLYALSDCVAAAQAYEKDFEGFVVRDANFNRIKIKTPWYIAMHHMKGNGIITINNVIEMWQKDTLDDFVAFYPEYMNFIQPIIKHLNRLIAVADLAYVMISRFEEIQSRADFAAHAKTYNRCIQAFLFARLDNKVDSAAAFFKTYRSKNITAYLEEFITTKNIGVNEDE